MFLIVFDGIRFFFFSDYLGRTCWGCAWGRFELVLDSLEAFWSILLKNSVLEALILLKGFLLEKTL